MITFLSLNPLLILHRLGWIYFVVNLSLSKKKSPCYFFPLLLCDSSKARLQAGRLLMHLCSGVLKRTWAKAQLAFGSSPQWVRSLHKAAWMTFNTAGRQRAGWWLTQNKHVLRSTRRGPARAWGLLRLQNSSEVCLWLLNLKTQQHLHAHLWWGVKDLLNLNKTVLDTQTETKREWICSQRHRAAYQLCYAI